MVAAIGQGMLPPACGDDEGAETELQQLKDALTPAAVETLYCDSQPDPQLCTSRNWPSSQRGNRCERAWR